jgi:hypothetical protein
MLRAATSSARLRALLPLRRVFTGPHDRGRPEAWRFRPLVPRSRLYSSQEMPPKNPNLSEPEMVLGGLGLVAFGPELKLGVSKHTADLASRSLQDETLRDNTRELASQIVQTVLNDPKVLDQASRFLQRVRNRSKSLVIVMI